MPRYPGQNLAALNPAYRKEHKIDDGSQRLSRYTFGKSVFVAAGEKNLSGGFCARLIPPRDSSNPSQLAVFREGREEEAFGDWCRLLTAAYWVGNPGVCFIVHDNNPELDIKQSPYFLLRDAARANTETPGIGRLFTELTQQRVMNSHIGSLSPPEKMLFISASVVYVDERGQVALGAFGDDPKRNARVIGLKYSATQGLLSALHARDQQTGEFLSGDMLSTGPAKLLTILPESFQAGPQQSIGVGEHGPDVFHCPPYARSQDPNAQYIIGRPPQKSRSSFTHYCILHDTFRGQQITLDDYADRLNDDNQSLDEMLFVPSYDEQAELLSRAFPHEALDFAWQDFPEYRRHLRGRTTTAAPAREIPDPASVAPWDQPVRPTRPTSLNAGDLPAALSDYPATATQPVELSAEEEAGVADIFSNATPAPAPVAAVPPPPPRPSAKGGRPSPMDIVNRARKTASNG